jgi:hypothetical protein
MALPQLLRSQEDMGAGMSTCEVKMLGSNIGELEVNLLCRAGRDMPN